MKTKSNIETMMLTLEESSIKLSNMTRSQSSIKNTNYVENLLQDDRLEDDDDPSEVPKKMPVRTI